MSDQIIPCDYYVYLHRRATTGGIFYVGKGHGSRAFDSIGRNRHWNFVVKKHGYTVEIVQDGLQEWAAFELECDLIALYGRKDCGLGELVNYTDGGEGATGTIQSEETRLKKRKMRLGKRLSEEIKKKISETNRITKSDPALKKRASEISRGEKNHMFGKKASAETRAKMSKSHIGKVNPKAVAALRLSNDAAKKPVLCLKTGEVFSGASDAELFLRSNGFPKASASGVSACCRGIRKNAYGLTWAFA